ncbi:hypothetical protein OUZ56_033586 [Daphnia magna]|uniref:Uncharacterized protein n=1 Tax=Daphnia magna TaxID=35525 RepID=A0ABR0BAV4_9CRUS|nr:hypothetical protein OUZ56_033586 [Daphnia magna]
MHPGSRITALPTCACITAAHHELTGACITAAHHERPYYNDRPDLAMLVGIPAPAIGQEINKRNNGRITTTVRTWPCLLAFQHQQLNKTVIAGNQIGGVFVKSGRLHTKKETAPIRGQKMG